jgi:hypothetical protein
MLAHTISQRLQLLIERATNPPPYSLTKQHLVIDAVQGLPPKPDPTLDFRPLIKAVFFSAWPRFKWLLLATVLMSALSSGLNVLSPRIMRQMTDLLVDPSATDNIESRFFVRCHGTHVRLRHKLARILTLLSGSGSYLLWRHPRRYLLQQTS